MQCQDDMMRSIGELTDRFYKIVNGEDGDFSEIFSEDFEMDIMKGFAFGGVHKGLSAVNMFFEDFGAHFDGWAVDVNQKIQPSENSMIITGRYRSRGLKSGTDLSMETVHFWTADDGWLKTYKHYCDTAILSQVMEHQVPQY